MPVDPTDNRYAESAVIVDLSATAGTANNTIVDAGAAYSQTNVNDNFRDVAAKINEILAALRKSSIISEA